MYPFYSSENLENIKPVNKDYSYINDPYNLYLRLSAIWSKETCAPRMANRWTKENKTLGQCSITSFLAQDIFGGDVYGIKLDDGNFHCYNMVDGVKFDLTSEQFEGRKLDYEDSSLQSREKHFSKEEKYRRYLKLKNNLSR